MAKKKKKKQRRTEHQTRTSVSLITVADPKSPISEKYRTLRTNIRFAMAGKNLQTLVVTSSGPSEGKSTTSANLASVFAQTGQNVLLVDADLRKPVVAKTFDLPNETGLSVYLSDPNVRVEEIVQPSYILDNMDIVTSGPIAPNPSELLQSNRMNQFLTDLEKYYDTIIIDMPPVLVVTDAQIVSTKVDGTLLVVREEQSTKQSVKKSVELLRQVDANLLGVVYNGLKRDEDKGYYYYYGGDKK